MVFDIFFFGLLCYLRLLWNSNIWPTLRRLFLVKLGNTSGGEADKFFFVLSIFAKKHLSKGELVIFYSLRAGKRGWKSWIHPKRYKIQYAVCIKQGMNGLTARACHRQNEMQASLWRGWVWKKALKMLVILVYLYWCITIYV